VKDVSEDVVLNRVRILEFVDQREAECDGDEERCGLLNASTETCWSEIATGWPSVANQASPQCEEL